MGFTKRFGGWRPVQFEEGRGQLRGTDPPIEMSVDYRFEVWHQMVDGLPGPFRCEGRLACCGDGSGDGELPRAPHEADALLILEDGRFLPLTLGMDGALLSHRRPSTADPREEQLPN